ncbi:hypothetical protein IU459_10800 [Nocardia amamiensis]|uniref:Uncharacterized protein n=1 Tax=Nocardia amamiensis TaxID=404578 RepID=A0ABS0CNA9_9NOCA|nr:hypothetical protein [Nocardia amamiensis]MBF6298035.1 hypothetical protein [Nocardia amamiensis]
MTSPAVQLRRRVAAAHRMEGGDPWPREHDELPITAAQLTAWAHAAAHILSDGLTPVVPVEILRALWRCGGEERDLAVRVAETGGATAAA